MVEVGQEQHCRLSVIPFENNRNARRFAAGIKLDPDGLQRAVFDLAVNQPDCERVSSDDAGTALLQQDSCPLLGTRHQWFLLLIEYKNRH
jgi:hypothetical protein